MVHLTKNQEVVPTKREQQIIAGTILGGSSIVLSPKGKHCYLSMRGKDGKWLEFKAFELNRFSSFAPFTKEATNRWHSLCYPIFDDYRNIFYRDNKRVLDLNALESLWSTGLAIWFGDAGKFKNGKVIMNTHIWGERGSEIIAEYFRLCMWQAKVTKDRNYFRVHINREDSVSFMKTVMPELRGFVGQINSYIPK